MPAPKTTPSQWLHQDVDRSVSSGSRSDYFNVIKNPAWKHVLVIKYCINQ